MSLTCTAEQGTRRNISRAIPESAVSRRRSSSRESGLYEDDLPKRTRSGSEQRRNSFGERRSTREEFKRGSRPLPNQKLSRQPDNLSSKDSSSSQVKRPSIRTQTSRGKVEDATFSQNINESDKKPVSRKTSSSRRSTSKNQAGRYAVGAKKNKPRDNSSRFDD